MKLLAFISFYWIFVVIIMTIWIYIAQSYNWKPLILSNWFLTIILYSFILGLPLYLKKKYIKYQQKIIKYLIYNKIFPRFFKKFKKQRREINRMLETKINPITLEKYSFLINIFLFLARPFCFSIQIILMLNHSYHQRLINWFGYYLFLATFCIFSLLIKLETFVYLCIFGIICFWLLLWFLLWKSPSIFNKQKEISTTFIVILVITLIILLLCIIWFVTFFVIFMWNHFLYWRSL